MANVCARMCDLCIGICVCTDMVLLRYFQFKKALDSWTGRGEMHAWAEE